MAPERRRLGPRRPLLGLTTGKLALALAAAVAVAASAGAGASGSSASRAGGLLVLLADNRVVRLSPEAGVEAVRRLAPTMPHTMEAGRLLAPAVGGRAAYALVRRRRHDELVLVDARTLAVRRRIPLAEGIRYRGVVVGPRSHRLYVYGNRPGILDPARELRPQAAVVTVVDRSGKRIATRVVRAAAGSSWWVYWGTLSQDERRLYLSYHGGCTPQNPQLCTTGADRVGVGGVTFRPCAAAVGKGGHSGCLRKPHGLVQPLPNGRLIAASGEAGILELNQAGTTLRTHPSVSRDTHLMDFALDASRRSAYTSSCDGTVRRLALASGVVSTLASDVDCGIRIALGPRSTAAIAIATRGYPGAAPEAKLVLVSLTTGDVVGTRPLRADPIDLLAVP